MRIALQPAFLLHQRPYRETSVLLELFTQDYGRIAAIAKGVRQARSKWRALLQPFIPLTISCQGKGELMHITAIEPDGVPNHLRGDSLIGGLYLNELLIHVLHRQDPHQALYLLYHATLANLQGPVLAQQYLRLFEKKLLEELGYGLSLHYDTNGMLLRADSNYQFHNELGFELYKGSDLASFKVFSGKCLLALASEQLEDEACLREIKRLMRLALAPVLGKHKIYARELFKIAAKENLG